VEEFTELVGRLEVAIAPALDAFSQELLGF
jgi:hypothetical protein